jgi:hypothetical protein
MNIKIIKAPKSWKDVEFFVVDYTEDSEIYKDGINLESVEVIPKFGKEDALYFIPEFKATGSHYRISILNHLSESASDEIKALLIARLKAEKIEDETEALENSKFY